MEPSLSKRLFPVPFHQNKFLKFLSNFLTYHPNNIFIVNVDRKHPIENSISKSDVSHSVQLRDENGMNGHTQMVTQPSLDINTNSNSNSLRLSIDSIDSNKINNPNKTNKTSTYRTVPTLHSSFRDIPHFVPVLTPLSLFERTLCTRQLNQSIRFLTLACEDIGMIKKNLIIIIIIIIVIIIIITIIIIIIIIIIIVIFIRNITI